MSSVTKVAVSAIALMVVCLAVSAGYWYGKKTATQNQRDRFCAAVADGLRTSARKLKQAPTRLISVGIDYCIARRKTREWAKSVIAIADKMLADGDYLATSEVWRQVAKEIAEEKKK